MSTPITPSPSSGEPLAEEFVDRQLHEARVMHRNAGIGAALALLVIGGYLLFITHRFMEWLAPTSAATLAQGVINQQLEDNGPALTEQIKTKVPEMIAQAPDYALKQLPLYRVALEDRVDQSLTKYSQSTSQQLGTQLDDFLGAHKDNVQALLTNANDPAAMQQMGAGLKQLVLDSLNDKPAGGESAQQQISQSLNSMQQVEKTVHRLATANDLSPQELKTRRALAIIAQTIDQTKLPTIRDAPPAVQQAINGGTDQTPDAAGGTAPPAPGMAAPPHIPGMTTMPGTPGMMAPPPHAPGMMPPPAPGMVAPPRPPGMAPPAPGAMTPPPPAPTAP